MTDWSASKRASRQSTDWAGGYSQRSARPRFPLSPISLSEGVSLSREGHWAALMVKAICAAVIFVATVQTLLIIAPALETRYWPPVSKLTILDIRENAEGHAVIDAHFTKVRPCEYLGISWFRGNPAGEFERVPVILLRREGDTASPNRPVGSQKAGPWIISLTPQEVLTNSFARLLHRCSPLWITTTEFYP